MTLSPEDQKKLYELAEKCGDYAKPGITRQTFVDLIEAVLSLCKPPEPEKVETFTVSSRQCGRGIHFQGWGDLTREEAGRKIAHLIKDGADYIEMKRSSYRGQGKPEDGE